MTDQATDQTTNEEQEKPTLAMARAYIANLREVTGAMVEGRELQAHLTPADIWKIVHERLGKADRLFEIAQAQLKRI